MARFADLIFDGQGRPIALIKEKKEVVAFQSVKKMGDGKAIARIELSNGSYCFSDGTPVYFNKPWGGKAVESIKKLLVREL